jgi:hypothetical protein
MSAAGRFVPVGDRPTDRSFHVDTTPPDRALASNHMVIEDVCGMVCPVVVGASAATTSARADRARVTAPTVTSRACEERDW